MPRQTVSKAAEQAVPEFDQKRSEFREFYGSDYPRLRAAEKTFRNLIQLLLGGISIEEPKVTSRLKDRDESIAKFERKYRTELEKTGKNYDIRDFITDLIGVRVICYYESDIDLIEDVLKENFEIVDRTDKTGELNEEVSSFGYKGLHLDLKLKTDRNSFPEYSNFSDLQFEVQIRSLAQDAWSEVDHKLKYKRQIPNKLKRRIVRLAALFELVDQEFMAIRDETRNLEESAERKTLDDDGGIEQAALDTFSVIALMRQHFPHYKFDASDMDKFLDEIKSMNSQISFGEFATLISASKAKIDEYKEHKRKAEGRRLNPYTHVRHALFVGDEQKFRDSLYPGQAASFKEWLTENS